jgi:hypothetical protein
VEVWKAKEYCGLEDGAYLHFLVCLKEKNLMCFKDQENSMEDILASFFHTMYLWTVAFVSPTSISYSDFLVRFSFSS